MVTKESRASSWAQVGKEAGDWMGNNYWVQMLLFLLVFLGAVHTAVQGEMLPHAFHGETGMSYNCPYLVMQKLSVMVHWLAQQSLCEKLFHFGEKVWGVCVCVCVCLGSTRGLCRFLVKWPLPNKQWWLSGESSWTRAQMLVWSWGKETDKSILVMSQFVQQWKLEN